ncbi:hypothetical protein ACOME3_005006 [Neoechinorhynchus agilis]
MVQLHISVTTAGGGGTASMLLWVALLLLVTPINTNPAGTTSTTMDTLIECHKKCQLMCHEIYIAAQPVDQTKEKWELCISPCTEQCESVKAAEEQNYVVAATNVENIIIEELSSTGTSTGASEPIVSFSYEDTEITEEIDDNAEP